MAQWRSAGLLLACGALAACASGPRFERPEAQGMPFDRGIAEIPEAYRGLWADKPESCGVTRDFGRQARIAATAIGEARVTEVWVYSDHPAVIVWVDFDEPRPVQLFLDLSLDGQYLSIARSQEEPEIMVRCPAD